jgi:hypothetical protein
VGIRLAAAVLAATVAAALLSGFATIRGGDWTAGTDTAYCGIYWPHLDAYCQRGG